MFLVLIKITIVSAKLRLSINNVEDYGLNVHMVTYLLSFGPRFQSKKLLFAEGHCEFENLARYQGTCEGN